MMQCAPIARRVGPPLYPVDCGTPPSAANGKMWVCAPMLVWPDDMHMRVQLASFADGDVRSDHAIRPDDGPTADRGLRIHHSRPIDLRFA